jgi:hypothetical protein
MLRFQFNELMEQVPHPLTEPLDGSVSWYTTVVKLDLEARKEVLRIPSSVPQRLRLA